MNKKYLGGLIGILVVLAGMAKNSYAVSVDGTVTFFRGWPCVLFYYDAGWEGNICFLAGTIFFFIALGMIGSWYACRNILPPRWIGVLYFGVLWMICLFTFNLVAPWSWCVRINLGILLSMSGGVLLVIIAAVWRRGRKWDRKESL